MNSKNTAKAVTRAILPEKLRHRVNSLIRRTRISSEFSFSETLADAPKSPFPFAASTENPLHELGERYLPTKRFHNYLIYYWIHFRDIRFDVRNVLEIGVQSDRSIRMWEEFFPNATIYGLDVDPECKKFEGDRRKIFIGDQSDPESCHRVVDSAGGALDIVIDDGSHRVEHQLASFGILFPTLTDNGIYVVEDTGGCVGDPELQTVSALKKLVDSVMYWPDGFEAKNWPHLTEFSDDAKWIDKNVIGVSFYRWIVFVMRGRNPQTNPYLTKTSPNS